MNLVLLSGGSGKRLWPLSNENRSKQFLKVLKDEQGRAESMVQRVYRQLQKIEQDHEIVIATSFAQVPSIVRQLGDGVDIVIEPERRDTFPAIALSAAYLHYEKKLPLDEVMLVLPVDPYADDAFFESLRGMEKMVRDDVCQIGLVGIRPTYPSEKYGYIQPAKALTENSFSVSHFVEKPDVKTAEGLLQSGAFWNGGCFALRIGHILEILQKYIRAENYQDVFDQYGKLPKISFDYEVLEKASSLAMVAYDGQWKDLGTWNTLCEEMSDHVSGKVLMDDFSPNTHVINELNVPAVVMGAKDMIVVACPDGILVSDKGRSSFMKPYVDQIEQMPMYSKYVWGSCQVLDFGFAEEEGCVQKIILHEGQLLQDLQSEGGIRILTVFSGEGTLIENGESRSFCKGDSFTLGPGALCSLRAQSRMEIIDLQPFFQTK